MTLPSTESEQETAYQDAMGICESFPMPVPLEDMMPRFEGLIRSHEASWVEYRLAIDVMDLKGEIAELKNEVIELKKKLEPDARGEQS